MAAIPYDAPRPYSNTGQKTFPRSWGTFSSTQTFDTGNFVVLTNGVVSICSNNAMSISGLSDHPAQAIFEPIGTELTSQRGLFGAPTSTAVQPFAPGVVDHYCPAANGQLFEISLKETFLITMVGAQSVGITIDPTTSLWIASTALSAAATIVKPLPIPGVSQQGNTGQRVIIQFTGAGVVVGA